MPDIFTIAAALYVTIATPTFLWTGFVFGRRRRRRRIRESASGENHLEFTDVCHAAARAKDERREVSREGEVDREFADGVDAVLAELMSDGHCEDPDEMRIAYLVGGQDVELDRDGDVPPDREVSDS